MPNYLTLSWNQFEDDTHQLCDKLLACDKKWNAIVAIARGGLVPATILSHRLSIHWLDTICINSYDDDTFSQKNLEVLKELKNDSQNILVVDDLVDTGDTFRLVRQMLPNAHFSCVYAKPAGISSTDVYSLEVPTDTWLVFPWEEQLVA